MAASNRNLRAIEMVDNLPKFVNFDSKDIELLLKKVGVSSDGGTTIIEIGESGGNFAFGSKKLTGVAQGTAEGDAVALDSGAKVPSTLLPDLSATYIPTTQKGTANGVAELDGAGKVPVAQLPSAVMTYEGVWNATTNSPTLVDGTGDAGMVYRVSTAGSQDLGSGSQSFEIGDYVIYNGTTWEKSDTTDAVASVNGKTGIVTLNTDEVSEGTTNKYFSDAAAIAASVLGGAITDGEAKAPTHDAVFDALADKSDSSHTHDAIYAALGHNHDTTYAAILHDHNTEYAALGHNHDTEYSALDHVHEASEITGFDAAAKAAAVVNSTEGSETDQAASVSAMKTYVGAQVGSANSTDFLNKEGGAVAHTVGQVVLFNAVAGGMKKALATDTALAPSVIIAMVKDASIADDAAGQYYLPRKGTVVGGFTGLTKGSPLYLSRSSAGGYAVNLSGFTTGDHVIFLGWAVSATEMQFIGEYQYQIG